MTAAVKLARGKTEDIHGMARRMYDEAGQVASAAADKIVGQIRRRPAMQEIAFKMVADDLVNRIISGDRRTILSGGSTGAVISEPAFVPQSVASKAASSARLRAVGERLTGLYLAKFKHNGEEFLLGNATPEQLRPVAAQHLSQGATMVRTGRWLEKIIASAKDGQPIHKSVSLVQLARMQKDALSSPV